MFPDESTHENEFHNVEVRDTEKNGKEGSQLADLIQGSKLMEEATQIRTLVVIWKG